MYHQLFAAIVLTSREIGFQAIRLVVYRLQGQGLGTFQRTQICRELRWFCALYLPPEANRRTPALPRRATCRGADFRLGGG